MKLIKVGSATLNQTPLDWKGNKERIIKAIDLARNEGVGLLCLPELCISGYGCEDVFFSPDLQERSARVLFEIAEHTSGIAVCIGLALYQRNALYNAVALVANGQVAGFVAKRHLAGDGVHYEPRWFKPWPRKAVDYWEWEGTHYPVGDLVFEFGSSEVGCQAGFGLRVGFEICEDAWGAHRPGVDLVERAVDVILNPSASHFAFGKYEVRKRFVLEGSRAFGVTYVYANLCGNEAGRLIYDGGGLIASSGEMLAIGRRFVFEDIELSCATVDLSQTRMLRSRIAAMPSAIPIEPSFQCVQDMQSDAQVQDNPDLSSGTVNVNWSLPEAKLLPTSVTDKSATAREGTSLQDSANSGQVDWEFSSHLREEEFTRAAALGLFDYLRKSKSSGFVLSLSGGADSSAIAVLVNYMARLAVQELGSEDRVVKSFCLSRTEVVDSFARPEAMNSLMKRLLTCVYQSTRNSSQTTLNAARGLAEFVGAKFFQFEIDTLVEDYKRMVAGAMGRELNWETDDIALQNIQARVRAPGVWMIANLQKSLLLATSNRSEVSVGYATMDGDTAGSISPLAGIDKAFIRKWLRWVETTGPMGLGPMPALRLVNEQEPTAELRPSSHMQTDEADLMPYPVLNEVEALAIRDKLSPGEVCARLALIFPEYGQQDLKLWVKRFFRLWCQNQWKRERFAPSFHYDDRNLDPRSWCRFPILSGGYEEEFEELV